MWKEYRYYLSSGVGSNIRIKISLVELAPTNLTSKNQLEGEETKTEEETLDEEKEEEKDTSNHSESIFPANLEQTQTLNQFYGGISDLKNSSMTEIFVTAQIFSDGFPLHPMTISSKCPTRCSETSIYWNEWLSFPVKYRDLSRNSVLSLTIWGVGNVPIGGTTISFFTKCGVLKDGLQCLRIWKGQEGDCVANNCATPSEIDEEWQRQEYFRLDKLREKYERQEIQKNDWMDGVTDRRIARIRRGSEPPRLKDPLAPFCVYREEACLWIEMPSFGHPVVYEEEPYAQKNWTPYVTEVPKRVSASPSTFTLASVSSGAGGPPISSASVSSSSSTLTAATSATSLSPNYLDSSSGTMLSNRTSAESMSNQDGPTLICVWDPDLNEENPAERKYRKLARDILRGSIDPNLKPSRDEKAAIDLLLSTPTDTLKNDQKDLLWKFRYTLTDNKKAVVKFLLSVDWNDETEVKQTSELLNSWCEIDIADALKLLGRQKEFKHEIVRNFAVSTLAKAKNEDLLDFLLQLVQALRYDKTPAAAAATSGTGAASPSSAATAGEDGSTLSDLGVPESRSNASTQALGPLARFLISRSTTNFQMANYFYWYLKVEAGDHADGEMYRAVLTQMLEEMKEDEHKRAIYDMLIAQDEFMVRLLACHSRAREEKGKKDQKEEKLRHYLKQFPWPKGIVIRLPLDPTIHLSGIVASSGKMFKSAMYPAVIEFNTVIPDIKSGSNSSHSISGYDETDLVQESVLLRDSLSSRMMSYLSRDREGPMYKVMVKNGDDLRQDQLIMQMFILMDRLLKKVNLDLKLTPYRILATSSNDGLMEFVTDSCPVSYVVANFETPQVLSFLRKHNPDPNGDYGVSPEALSNYIKSVAGYCVLTYLLGIGDRHLDNLMMKTQGHLFHIDFGFIFGADPKLYPPPFKLTKEMVEGMGGPESEHYLKFKTYCCQAYNWLRKSADLILNLLSLMVDAGIEELSADPVTTLQKVQEKFRLDLTDEQAEQFFLGLINDSVTALFPVLMEYIHKVATKLR